MVKIASGDWTEYDLIEEVMARSGKPLDYAMDALRWWAKKGMVGKEGRTYTVYGDVEEKRVTEKFVVDMPRRRMRISGGGDSIYELMRREMGDMPVEQLRAMFSKAADEGVVDRLGVGYYRVPEQLEFTRTYVRAEQKAGDEELPMPKHYESVLQWVTGKRDASGKYVTDSPHEFSVFFRVPEGASSDEVQELAARALEDALNAKSYPDSDTILAEWSRGEGVSGRMVVERPSPSTWKEDGEYVRNIRGKPTITRGVIDL